MSDTSGTQPTLLDVTRDVCPMTFVRTRLALDRLPPGATLVVRVRGDEARHNVPASARELGHAIDALEEAGDGVLAVWIRKTGA